MSAPLVVNTNDGTVWTRRAATRAGEALYAMAGVDCPEMVMATLAELAEHGIAGSADVLPVPVGPAVKDEHSTIAALIGDAKPARDGLLVQLAESVRDRREHDHSTQREDWYCMNLTSFMGERMGPVLRRLLDAEARVAELEAQRDRRRGRLVSLQNDALNMRGALSPNGEDRKVPMPLGETLTPAVEWLIGRVAELEAERHSTNEALDDAVQELRSRSNFFQPGRTYAARAGWPGGRERFRFICESVTADPDSGEPRALGHHGRLRTADGEWIWTPNPRTYDDWRGGAWTDITDELATPSVEMSADKLTRMLAPTQALLEDPHDSPLHHPYRVGRDLPETGGTQ